jgi:hypothetical protein
MGSGDELCRRLVGGVDESLLIPAKKWILCALRNTPQASHLTNEFIYHVCILCFVMS